MEVHRTATFYDLKLTAKGYSRSEEYAADFEAAPKTLLELYSFIKQVFDGGDQIIQKGRTEKSVKHYLADMELRDTKLVLLVNRSDPTAPDAVSTDPENKSRVVHKKPPNHGGDFSAHVVIELKPVKGDNYYLCVIETVYGSGLHASAVAGYIRHVIRYCKKQFPEEFKIAHIGGVKDKSGAQVMVSHLHYVELQGHPSEEFEKDLEGGTLGDIELLDFSEKGAEWDEQGEILENSRIVKLSPQKKIIGDLKKVIGQVRNRALKKDDASYFQMRIRFKNEKEEPREATISTDTDYLIDEKKYVKKHVIRAEIVNTASLEVISNVIVKEVISLME